MAEDSIILDNDLASDRIIVRAGGRDWLFVFDKGSVEWWLRWSDWSKNEAEIVEKQGAAENLRQLYDLAEAVLCPENGKRADLERRGPATIALITSSFSAAWFRGPDALIQAANERAKASEQAGQAPPAHVTAISASATTKQAAPPRRARRAG